MNRLWPCNLSTMAGEYIQFDGRSLGSVSRHRLLDKLFGPKLKNEQRPNLLISGKLAFLLQTDNLFNGLRLKDRPARGITRKQCVPHKIPQLEPKPRIGGEQEAPSSSAQGR